jgi:hypothetical protein
MTIDFAVERLYEAGWEPSFNAEMEVLPDGRKVPALVAVQREFAQAGLDLSIKQNLIFGCYRATWAHGDQFEGTVVGDSELEAAVYALAQLRATRGHGLAATAV